MSQAIGFCLSLEHWYFVGIRAELDLYHAYGHFFVGFPSLVDQEMFDGHCSCHVLHLSVQKQWVRYDYQSIWLQKYPATGVKEEKQLQANKQLFDVADVHIYTDKYAYKKLVKQVW